MNNGGGIARTTTVWSCSIFNNKAGTSGGGVWNDGRCYNCDIYNNYAPSYGGIAEGSYTNCTIAHNKSFSGNENNGRLTNCILVGSFEGYASYSIFTDSYISGAGNFLVTLKEIKFRRPTSFIGNAANDKQLEELKKADFGLSEGSSAIDMGRQDVNQALPVEDISGYPRPMGKRPISVPMSFYLSDRCRMKIILMKRYHQSIVAAGLSISYPVKTTTIGIPMRVRM